MLGSKLLGNYAATAGKLGQRYATSGGINVINAALHANKFGATGIGMSTYAGAAAGAAYGAFSDNTSVIGGAMMGAGLGAGAYRYGGAGMKAYGRGSVLGSKNPYWQGAKLGQRMLGAIAGQMKGDALLASNKAVNGFRALKNRY